MDGFTFTKGTLNVLGVVMNARPNPASEKSLPRVETPLLGVGGNWSTRPDDDWPREGNNVIQVRDIPREEWVRIARSQSDSYLLSEYVQVVTEYKSTDPSDPVLTNNQSFQRSVYAEEILRRMGETA